MTPLASDFLRAFLRSFSVQASWNHRSQLAGGLCYALLPLLRRIHAGDPEALHAALRRHLAPFNAHPYLAPLAIGALARLELNGAGEARIERNRRALTASLGALGDRLIWSGWRPFCLLLSMTVYAIGGTVAGSILLFLVLYNAGHVGLRAWALVAGWREGPEAVRRFTRPGLRRAARALATASAVLAGLVGVLAAWRMGGAPVVGVGTVALVGAGALAAGAWSRPELAARLAPWVGVAALVLTRWPA